MCMARLFITRLPNFMKDIPTMSNMIEEFNKNHINWIISDAEKILSDPLYVIRHPYIKNRKLIYGDGQHEMVTIKKEYDSVEEIKALVKHQTFDIPFDFRDGMGKYIDLHSISPS